MTLLAFVDVAFARLPHRITAACAAGLLADGDPRASQRAAIAATMLAVFLPALPSSYAGSSAGATPPSRSRSVAALGWHGWLGNYAGTLLGFGAAAVLASGYGAWAAGARHAPPPSIPS